MEKLRRKKEKEEVTALLIIINSKLFSYYPKEKEKLRLEKESTKEAQVLWLKPRDDLECSDHKVKIKTRAIDSFVSTLFFTQPLPKPSPVQTRLPMEHFGDALMLLQAIFTFKQFLDVENYFKDGGGISFGTQRSQ